MSIYDLLDLGKVSARTIYNNLNNYTRKLEESIQNYIIPGLDDLRKPYEGRELLRNASKSLIHDNYGRLNDFLKTKKDNIKNLFRRDNESLNKSFYDVGLQYIR